MIAVFLFAAALVALLYFWLLGHWYAQILAFIVIGGTLALFAWAVDQPLVAFAMVLLGWIISRIPILWHTRQKIPTKGQYRLDLVKH